MMSIMQFISSDEYSRNIIIFAPLYGYTNGNGEIHITDSGI